MRGSLWGVAALVLAGSACGDAVPNRRVGARASEAATADVLARPASGPLPALFGVGRRATPEEIARLDRDVGPDGAGLPPGRGGTAEGARVYGAYCASCHGPAGEGTPAGEALVSSPDDGFPDAEAGGGSRALGSYWPWPTTIFDYVRRAMPFDRPGTLSDDEVYAVAAWLLWKNGIVGEDAVMDASTLPAVVMPARDRFVPDDRPGT